MIHEILRDLVLILAVSAGSAYLMRRIHVPAITGFLLAGMLVGRGGLDLVPHRESIEALAETGVILLLFSVGLKISIRELNQLRAQVFGGGLPQVVLTLGATAFAMRALGSDWTSALVWGALVALSSTALVLTLLEERGELDTAHGRWMLGVLIFQDLAVVPILIGLPLMAGTTDASPWTVLLSVGKALAILVGVVVAGHFVFPRLTEQVVRVRSREVFTLTALLVVFGTAWLVSLFGLSMALGAFLAGMVLSESEYAQQILSEISALRVALNSLFFVSIGMLVEPSLWWIEPTETLALFVLVVAVKGAILALLARRAFSGGRTSALAAAGLAHMGEFSFVVAGAAMGLGLIVESELNRFLAIAVPSMLLAPGALALASRVRARPEIVADRDAGERDAGIPPAGAEAEAAGGAPGDRVVIVGYGLNGRNVARVLRLLEVPYAILELNALTVRRLREEGEPVFYGDATSEGVLRRAGVDRARALILAVSDPAGSRQMVALARKMNPGLRIIVRTRYVLEIEALRGLGADVVVPEEFETSLELAAQALATFGAPAQLIQREKALMRREQYGYLRPEASNDRERPASCGPCWRTRRWRS